MKYIQTTPNPSGAYPPPQSAPAHGLAAIPDSLVTELLAYNGFVELTVEKGAVTAAVPNLEAWEAWKASEEDKPSREAEEPVTWSALAEAYTEGVNEA